MPATTACRPRRYRSRFARRSRQPAHEYATAHDGAVHDPPAAAGGHRMSAPPPAVVPPLGSAVPVVQAEANRALQATARQVAALLRAIPTADVSIPRSEWTVAEAAIHLVSGTRMYLDCIQGQPSPVTDLAALPDMNRQLFRD